jgi:hypothetical protein
VTIKANPSRDGDAKPGVSPEMAQPPIAEDRAPKKAPTLEVALSVLTHPCVPRAMRHAATLACILVPVSAGTAVAACPAPPVSTPFAQWGDSNSYFAVPGGTFEGAQPGWTLSNATLTPGNEPFFVNGPSDNQSLTIGGGGSATSPYFCVDSTMSSMRLFADQVAPGGDLQITALVQTPNGVADVPVGDLGDGSMRSWAPTQPITGNSSQLAGSVMVALRFRVPPSVASWTIDDVYVDPYRSG